MLFELVAAIPSELKSVVYEFSYSTVGIVTVLYENLGTVGAFDPPTQNTIIYINCLMKYLSSKFFL